MNNDERLSRYLDGELTPEEQAETARRIAEAPELRRDFDQLKELERTLQQLTPELKVAIPQKMPRSRLRRLRAAALAAVALLVMTGAGWAAVKVIQKASPAEHSATAIIEPTESTPIQSSNTTAQRGPAPASPPPAPASEPTAAATVVDGDRYPVQFRVIDYNGTPIAGARIGAVRMAGWDVIEIASARTDRNGRAEMPPTDKWMYADVEHDGYQTVRARNRRIAPQNEFVFEIRLAPSSYATGRVLDTRGAPISDVAVTGDFVSAVSSIRWATTDSDGRFRVATISGNAIFFRHPNYAMRSAPVSYDGTVGDVTLHPGGSIRLRVTRGGKPVPGAKVRPSEVPHELGRHTDSNGYIQFDGLPSKDDEYDLFVAAGHVRSVVKASVLVGQVTSAALDLPGEFPAVIEGSVTVAGSPLANIEVEVAPMNARNNRWFTATTDSDGKFAVRVDYGQYLVSMNRAIYDHGLRYTTGPHETTVSSRSPAATVAVDLDPPALHYTAIEPTEDHELPDKMLVSLGGSTFVVKPWLLHPERGIVSYSPLEQIGVYDPKSTRYAFINRRDRQYINDPNPPELVPIDTIQPIHSTDALTGRVRSVDGTPLPGVIVMAQADGPMFPAFDTLATQIVLTDESGNFSIEPIVPTETYYFRMKKAGYAPQGGIPYDSIQPPANGAPVELIMAPLDRAITGRVVSRDGYPVSEASVSALAGGRAANFTKRTDARGQFTLPLPAGEFMLKAEALGAGSYTVGPIVPPATAVELMVDVWLHNPPPGVSIPTDEQTQLKDNHFKQLGLSFKMFANESRGQKYPPQSIQYGAFSPQLDMIYPEYAPDSKLIDLFRDEGDARAVYFGYAMTEPLAAHAFLDTYETYGPEAIAGQDLEVEPGTGTGNGGSLLMLREGIERFLITDINNPNAGAKAQSSLPIMWELPKEHQLGGWVLYLDGHTEWVEYPGKFPMEPGVIERVRGIMDAARAATHAPSP